MKNVLNADVKIKSLKEILILNIMHMEKQDLFGAVSADMFLLIRIMMRKINY